MYGPIGLDLCWTHTTNNFIYHKGIGPNDTIIFIGVGAVVGVGYLLQHPPLKV